MADINFMKEQLYQVIQGATNSATLFTNTRYSPLRKSLQKWETAKIKPFLLS